MSKDSKKNVGKKVMALGTALGVAASIGAGLVSGEEASAASRREISTSSKTSESKSNTTRRPKNNASTTEKTDSKDLLENKTKRPHTNSNKVHEGTPKSTRNRRQGGGISKSSRTSGSRKVVGKITTSDVKSGDLRKDREESKKKTSHLSVEAKKAKSKSNKNREAALRTVSKENSGKVVVRVSSSK